MDSFEINKLLGALLGSVFIVFSISLLADTIFYSPTPATPGYQIEVPEVVAEAVEDAEEGPNVLELIANADPAAGESAFRRCASCHTAEQGGPNRVGPNLWNTVMQPITHAEGFGYSSAMREFAAREEIWTYEHLAGFLENPRGYVPGTTMAFAGIRDVQEKANLIAYLRTMSDDPAPLPEVAEAPEEEEAETEAEPAQPATDEDGTAAGPQPDTGTPAVDRTEGAEEAETDGADSAEEEADEEAEQDEELEEEEQ